MQITTVGIDLAKNVFQVHGVNERGKALLKKRLRRDQLAAFFVNLPPCLIGMEACGSAHHWARKLQSFGHTVRLMAPQFVKPYVKSNKNDVADAEATHVPSLIEDATNELTGAFRLLIERLLEHFKLLDREVDRIEVQIKAWHRANEKSRRLESVPGIGPLTASALAATVGDAKNFDNGRQMAAWLGLVPRQHSSGGKATLLGMSKRGDAYLRTLLIARRGGRVVVGKTIHRNKEEKHTTDCSGDHAVMAR